MKKVSLILTIAMLSLPLGAQVKQTRPRITGIARVRIYVSDVGNSWHFYNNLLALPSHGGGCTNARPCLPVNRHQQIEFARTPKVAPTNWLAEIAFATDDVAQMHRYLLAHGVALSAISKDPNGAQHFELADPELNSIAFVQLARKRFPGPIASEQVGIHLLHAGFVVSDAAVEDHFYQDLLGFRPYWHGGFKDQDTDWEEIQVPDGTDWIEYMLNIPRSAHHKELGVQNHFSLGVTSVKSAYDLLVAHGLKVTDDKPEIGRDGKWSFDIYDPDDTRVEFIEFKPANKPCCHPYEAAHPTP